MFMLDEVSKVCKRMGKPSSSQNCMSVTLGRARRRSPELRVQVYTKGKRGSPSLRTTAGQHLHTVLGS